MGWKADVRHTFEAGGGQHFESVGRNLPADWIEEALSATGTATIRRRRLPAEQVVWLVIGMAMFRDRSIDEVVAKLDLALPGARATVSRSAIPQARARLGVDPMRWLFERSAGVWASRSASRHLWRGLSIFGLDGTSLRVADSEENRTHFGSKSGGFIKGLSAYPLLRLVVLIALRSRLIAAATFGRYEGTDERTNAGELVAHLPGDSLLIVDHNFFGAALLFQVSAGQNRHWLTVASSRNRWRVVEQIAPNDAVIEMNVSNTMRAAHAELPSTWQMRAISYQRKGFPPRTLLTSLVDPKRFPAEEIVALYHERWEVELAYDEIKTDLLDREETIRSRSVRGVEQEMWGILLAYNLIRLEIEQVAETAKVPPRRIGFVTALHLVRDEWLWCSVASPGAIPKHLVKLRQTMQHFVLPERRSLRSFPRAVKLKISPYPRKRATTTRAP